MENIWTISVYTFREALSRKIFLTFFGVSSFVILIFSIIFATVDVESFMPIVNVDGVNQTQSILTEISKFFKVLIVVPLFGGGLFLSIFSVSSFIPNLLEKGNIDLILSKPISRMQILMGKFLGGSFMVLINVLYLVIGIWILIGLKFGDWEAGMLVTIPTITFTFMVLYSLIILIGILTRSSVLAMMMTYLIFFVFSPLLTARDKIMMLFDNKFVEYLIDGLYYVLPKTSELGIMTGALASGENIGDLQPVYSSLIFMILTLLLSVIIFNKKDY